MYIVRNLTNKTIILSDLKAEIGPYKIMDLERIAARVDVERSKDLEGALGAKQLQFVKQTVVRIPTERSIPKPPRLPKVEQNAAPAFDESKLVNLIKSAVQQPVFDEARMKDLIREVINENKQLDIEEAVSKAVASGVTPLVDRLRDQINAGPVPVSTSESVKNDDSGINTEQLAELQQRAIENMLQEIQPDTIKKGKKIKIINQRDVGDLANEL